MSHTLKTQLKRVKQLEGRINPDTAWVESTRETLLKTITSDSVSAHTSVDHKKVTRAFQGFQAFFPTHMFSQARPVFVSLLVFLLAGSGWIASASASVSLPGDTLWQIKLATEKTQIVLASITGNDKKNVELQLKFAARRAEEIKVVASEDKFPPEEKAKRAGEGLKQLQENIASVDTAVHADTQKEDISKSAKDLNESTAQISATLKEVASTVQDVDENATLTKQVAAAQQAVDEVGINAVKIAVEGAQNDAERIAAQALVEQKIVSVLSDADGALHETAAVKALVELVDVNAVNASTTISTTLTITESVSSTSSTTVVPTSSSQPISSTNTIDTPNLSLIVQQPTVKQTISSILEQVDKTSESVQKQVDEIKVLISNNDLTGALEKAKELKRTTTASTQQTMEIKKTVDQVNTATLANPAIGNTTTTIPLLPPATGTSPVSGT